MINISKDELNNIDKLNINSNNKTHHNNNGELYIKNNVIYKISDYKYFFPRECERNIDFLIKNQITNIPTIYDKIYINGEFSGYQMEYIKNSMSFRDAIDEDIPFEDKLKAIADIYKALKELHSNNIFLGDVHSDNFLISNQGGYLIDIDYIRFPGDEFKFTTCYDIKPDNYSNKIIVPSIYTDNVKVMIASLSLLMNIDLEKYIDKKELSINLETIYNDIILPTNNEGLIDYFKQVMNQEKIEYFDDYLKRDSYFNSWQSKSK